MFSERTNWRLAPNGFTRAVEEARARGAHLLDLTASNPTRVGLEYDSEAILNALRSPQALDYEPQAKGLGLAREFSGCCAMPVMSSWCRSRVTHCLSFWRICRM